MPCTCCLPCPCICQFHTILCCPRKNDANWPNLESSGRRQYDTLKFSFSRQLSDPLTFRQLLLILKKKNVCYRQSELLLYSDVLVVAPPSLLKYHITQRWLWLQNRRHSSAKPYAHIRSSTPWTLWQGVVHSRYTPIFRPADCFNHKFLSKHRSRLQEVRDRDAGFKLLK